MRGLRPSVLILLISIAISMCLFVFVCFIVNQSHPDNVEAVGCSVETEKECQIVSRSGEFNNNITIYTGDKMFVDSWVEKYSEELGGYDIELVRIAGVVATSEMTKTDGFFYLSKNVVNDTLAGQAAKVMFTYLLMYDEYREGK